MKKLSIRAKIMLWFTLLSAVLLGVLIPTVYSTVAFSLRQTLQANLQMTVTQGITSLEEENETIKVDLEKLNLQDGCYLTILSSDGENLYTSKNASWLATQGLSYGANSINAGEKSWAIIKQAVEIDEMELDVIAATSTNYVDESLYNLTALLLFLVPLYLCVSALGSFFLAKRAMFPIRQITRTAQAIAHGDMSNRIIGISTQDEVGELADTFNEMLDTLEVSFQRERQFTSDASHELRTPITVISACTEDALSSSGIDLRENLKTIKNEAARMAKIISQLLMLSRGYEGRWHFEPDNILLYDVVGSVSEELKEAAEKDHITIHNDVYEELVLQADQCLLTQLFINLIGNAIKYGSSGGNVWLNAYMRENAVQIDVSDDGIGISEEDQPHIFERFYRADKARDRSGSGLGLSIAKWIVELHGGTIEVNSSIGHGTIFSIMLPSTA